MMMFLPRVTTLRGLPDATAPIVLLSLAAR
jgi:hypothetical protein